MISSFESNRLDSNAEFATLGHCIARIHEQIQKYLLQFSRRYRSDRMFRGADRVRHEFARFLNWCSSKRQCFSDDLVDIDFGKLRGVGTRKIQKAIDDLGSAECLLGDLLQQLVSRILGADFLSQHLRVAGNHG